MEHKDFTWTLRATSALALICGCLTGLSEWSLLLSGVGGILFAVSGSISRSVFARQHRVAAAQPAPADTAPREILNLTPYDNWSPALADAQRELRDAALRMLQERVRVEPQRSVHPPDGKSAPLTRADLSGHQVPCHPKGSPAEALQATMDKLEL